MGLRVVGAGVGRTGTTSLKAALELLLGGRCYHMTEVFSRPDDVAVWQLAAKGQAVDWSALFADYQATVDWPGAGLWRELADAFPDAIVLLSVRESPEAWWRSASSTIFPAIASPPPPEMEPWHQMVHDLLETTFDRHWADHDAAVAAYQRHNDEVRDTIAPERLLEWQPGDGWAPLCRRLGLGIPDTPFPHLNTTEDFNAGPGAPRD